MRGFVIAAAFALAACGASSAGSSGSSGTGTTHGTSASSGTSTAASTSTSSSSTSGGSSTGAPGDVLQQHGDARRSGVYVDAAFTRAKASTIAPDSSFAPSFTGPTYAQPLFLGGSAHDEVIVATEQNDVLAFDASSGAQLWSQNLGAPWPLSDLPCGNIDPLGITGTPVIDAATRTLYVDAMVHNVGHRVFALDADSGQIKQGWPVDLEGAATSNGAPFQSYVQNQRGALALAGGTLYVPFGGHYGDCGDYHGWVIAIDVNSRALSGWATRAVGGGIWAPGGVVLDGARPFVTTGNTFSASSWSDGEAVFELQASGAASSNYWAPSNWQYLDANDIDMSGSAPLVFDLGALHAAMALGKDGNLYLLDRDALGGIGAAKATLQASSDEIINGTAYLADGQGELVFFVSQPSSCPTGSGHLGAVRVSAGSPPTMSAVWCGDEGEGLPGGGSPIVTSPDGASGFVVWGVGAGGDGRLRGWDAETGEPLYDGSTALTDGVERFQAPIVAKGHLYIAADSKLERYRFP